MLASKISCSAFFPTVFQKRLAFHTSCSSILPCVLHFWCLSFCVSLRPKASLWRRYQKNWPKSESIFHRRAQPSKTLLRSFFFFLLQQESNQREAVQGDKTRGETDGGCTDNSQRIQVRKRQNLKDAEGLALICDCLSVCLGFNPGPVLQQQREFDRDNQVCILKSVLKEQRVYFG